MPKASLRPLRLTPGVNKGECSVCGEKFYGSHDSRDFKADILRQFDAHSYHVHRQQWDALQKKRAEN